MTGCGRAGRVTEGRYQPPRLPPASPLSAIAGTGCWMWLRWQRETRSLSCPPRYHPLPRPPFSPVAGRMTGRADKQGRYPPHPRLPSPFPHLTRCGAGPRGCGRAGRVKQGRYHPPLPSSLPPLTRSRCSFDSCFEFFRNTGVAVMLCVGIQATRKLNLCAELLAA